MHVSRHIKALSVFGNSCFSEHQNSKNVAETQSYGFSWVKFMYLKLKFQKVQVRHGV